MTPILLESAYKTLAAASNIKVGDRVTVFTTAVTDQMGWGNNWATEMTHFVGKTGTVIHADTGKGFYVRFDTGSDDTRILCHEWWFPFFVLKREKPAVKDVKLENGPAKIQQLDGQYKVTGVAFDLSEADLKVLGTAIRQFRKEVESFKA